MPRLRAWLVTDDEQGSMEIARSVGKVLGVDIDGFARMNFRQVCVEIVCAKAELNSHVRSSLTSRF